jgi:hypothetical protein
MPIRDLVKKNLYQRQYQRINRIRLSEEKKYRRQLQREFIQNLKDKPCTDCGHKYPHYVMDFDHVRGEKKYDLSRLAKISVNFQTILEEADKCEVVCSNCHRERTYRRRSG